ncbi:diguanylate cyclase domain-containing protein [Atlantibacter sp.]|uniref:sensor domain-containing diguanylate cyclase n=1 Tax=Atlantibacter sp. TaxID=1903473 RepID=UPI003917C330
MYFMRMLGTFLCFIPILSVLTEQHLHHGWLILLSVNAFIWPTVAFLLARRTRQPLITEHRSLVLDAAAGGFWIAMMSANPLPSVTIAAILLSDRLAAGGVELLRKAAGALVIGFLACWVARGMPLELTISQRTTYATLPLIAIYVLAVSALTDSIAIKLRQKSDELGRIAMMDPLLDIANRRLLEPRIHHELNKINQRHRLSALMFIDIDDFKEVNDRYGHKVGDSMLVAVAEILRRFTRQQDTPARLGGDEFVVLLPNTSMEEARAIGHAIMEQAALLQAEHGISYPCSLSIGIAFATREMTSTTDWLKAADDALYTAKRDGKNRIFAC